MFTAPQTIKWCSQGRYAHLGHYLKLFVNLNQTRKLEISHLLAHRTKLHALLKKFFKAYFDQKLACLLKLIFYG